MKTVQIYFSPKNAREGDNVILNTKQEFIGFVRAVLISDCDITHATMKGRVHARPNEVFVGAVAIE
jgi:hypothetical protein